jgi:uncharacterized protein (DUF1810 family)
MPADPFDLQRFVDAQDGVHGQALAELRAGRKESHWMWFVFPQIAGLGLSPMARRYAVSGLAEATAYLAHPVLGPRLVACAEALLGLPAADAVAVLGSIDAVKLRSSMTLFGRVPQAPACLRQVLERYYAGREDPETVSRL